MQNLKKKERKKERKRNVSQDATKFELLISKRLICAVCANSCLVQVVVFGFAKFDKALEEDNKNKNNKNNNFN